MLPGITHTVYRILDSASIPPPPNFSKMLAFVSFHVCLSDRDFPRVWMDQMDNNPYGPKKKGVKTNTEKHTNAWIAFDSRCRLDPAISKTPAMKFGLSNIQIRNAKVKQRKGPNHLELLYIWPSVAVCQNRENQKNKQICKKCSSRPLSTKGTIIGRCPI